MKRRLTARDLRFLSRQRVVRVATADGRGTPWAVPVCHAVDGGVVYFGSGKDGVKVRNIARTRKVALVADRYSDDWGRLRGLALVGRAAIFSRGPVFERGVRLLYRKYPQYRKQAPLDPSDSVIVRVTPTRAMSWGEQ